MYGNQRSEPDIASYIDRNPNSTDELYTFLMGHTHYTGQGRVPERGMGTLSFSITHYIGTGNHYEFPSTLTYSI